VVSYWMTTKVVPVQNIGSIGSTMLTMMGHRKHRGDYVGYVHGSHRRAYDDHDGQHVYKDGLTPSSRGTLMVLCNSPSLLIYSYLVT
jgi:hypothetical protein